VGGAHYSLPETPTKLPSNSSKAPDIPYLKQDSLINYQK